MYHPKNINDIILNNNVIDPYKLDIMTKQKYIKKKLDEADKSNTLTPIMSEIIKDFNYLHVDIGKNILDMDNILTSHNIKLKQEIDRIYKKMIKEEMSTRDNSSQTLYTKLTENLNKSMIASDKHYIQLQKETDKKEKQLGVTNQLLHRQIKYNIKDFHIRNNILKYIRVFMYILLSILIILGVINYIK